MALYDRYLIVDWSAKNSPGQGKDTIWLCLWDRHEGLVALDNPATRSQAMVQVSDICRQCLADGKRLFAGFDFAFGYPMGAAAIIADTADWSGVWSSLDDLVEDDEVNCSNRFEVASKLNVRFAAAIDEAPFWGHPQGREGTYANLEAKRPDYRTLPPCRLVEARLGSAQPVWKLAYAGSVGSQTLLGVPRLQQLRQAFGNRLAVWPFETAFDGDLSAPITIAEIYPSIVPVHIAPGEVKDAAQVRTLASLFAREDDAGTFGRWLAAPLDLVEKERDAVLAEEGWIVGCGREERATPSFQYVREPAEIYRQSFAQVEREAALDHLSAAMKTVAIRLVHSCGMTDIVNDLEASEGAAEAGLAALGQGARVLCDVEMVVHGIIAARLPADNEVVCTLNADGVDTAANAAGDTRSATAVDLWSPLEGAIVCIGNAPTALFRLLERVAAGDGRPALVIGIPVGFVGAVESKVALARSGLPFITVHGRRGGSAMASSVVNALAGLAE